MCADPINVIEGITLEGLHRTLEGGNLDPKEVRLVQHCWGGAILLCCGAVVLVCGAGAVVLRKGSIGVALRA